MADAIATTEAAAPASSSPATKKGKSGAVASKKPRVKPSHPPTSDMVNIAIKTLKERGGSSLQAIKKYISSNYKIDAEKLSPFIKKYLKSAVTGGQLIQTKGKGASGSFKLSASVKGKSESTQKKTSPKKPKVVASGEKKLKAKKAASPAKKKSAIKSGEKKKAVAPAKAAKKSGSVKAAKAPKEKSTKPKAAAKKPKTPKPKKAAPAKKASAAPKKAAAPKKK